MSNNEYTPTREQVDAALVAFTCDTMEEWDEFPENYKETLRGDMCAALVAAAGVTPQEPGEPTYSTGTRQWSGHCPCIRAEQVDPECEWHGRPEFRRGGALHPNALSVAAVNEAKLAEVIDDAFTERRPYERIAAGAARRAVERQDEWLRGGGQ